MKTIVIPTDFSPVSVNAMHYGIDMASKINAGILLFHVYQVPVSMTDVPIVMISVEELKKQAEEKMAVLKQQVEHLVSGGVKVYAEARLGNVTDELKDLCDRIKPFAVVMGTRGSSAMERVIFGSNTLTAIRHLTWPVITVPPGKTFGTGIKKVGLACDFRDVVTTTPSDTIRSFVKEFNASLHVLNSDYKDRHFKPETPEQSALLHTLLQELNPVYHFIKHKDIEDGVNEFAEKNNFDLLIVIPKKHKLLEGIFKPASTRQFVFQSHIPVMCIHNE